MDPSCLSVHRDRRGCDIRSARLLPLQIKALNSCIVVRHADSQWLHLCYLHCAGALNPLRAQPPTSTEEWDLAPADDELGTDLLFSEANRPEEIVETVHVEGLGCLELRSISRTHRHTLPHTGLMHWESGPALARFILAHPEVFAGNSAVALLRILQLWKNKRRPVLLKLTSICYELTGSRVLEVGCGSNPLVAFAALRHCRRVIACDGSPKALALMETNVNLNAR